MDDSFQLEPLMEDYQLIGDSQLLRLSEQYLNYQRRDGRLGLCISGQTISELYAAIVNRTYPVSFKIICLIGTNDITRNTPIEEMKLGMNFLIRLLLDERHVQQLILLTVPPVPKLASCPSHWNRLKLFNSHITTYTYIPSITVFEIHELFLAPSDPSPCREGDGLPKPIRLRSPSKDRPFLSQAELLYPKFNASEVSAINNAGSNILRDRASKAQAEFKDLRNPTRYQSQPQQNREVSSSCQNDRNANQHKTKLKRGADPLNPKLIKAKDSSILKPEKKPKDEKIKLETKPKIVEDMWNVDSIKSKSSPSNSPEKKEESDERNSSYQKSSETQSIPSDKPKVRQSPIGADSHDQELNKTDTSSIMKSDCLKKTNKSEWLMKKFRNQHQPNDRPRDKQKNSKVSSRSQNPSNAENESLVKLGLNANLSVSKSEEMHKTLDHQPKSETRCSSSQRTEFHISENKEACEVQSEQHKSNCNLSVGQKATNEEELADVIILDSPVDTTHTINRKSNSSNSNLKSTQPKPKTKSVRPVLSVILNHLNLVKAATAKSDISVSASREVVTKGSEEPMDSTVKTSPVAKDKYQSDSSADSYCKDSKICKVNEDMYPSQQKSSTKFKLPGKNQGRKDSLSSGNSDTTKQKPLRGTRAARKVPVRIKDPVPESEPPQNDKTKGKMLGNEVAVVKSESNLEISYKTLDHDSMKCDSSGQSESSNNCFGSGVVEFSSGISSESFNNVQASKEIHLKKNHFVGNPISSDENQPSRQLHPSESNATVSPSPFHEDEVNRMIRSSASTFWKPVNQQENETNRWNRPSETNFATSPVPNNENQISRPVYPSEMNSVGSPAPFFQSKDSVGIHSSANTVPCLVNRQEDKVWNYPNDNNFVTSPACFYENQLAQKNLFNEYDSVGNLRQSPEKQITGGIPPGGSSVPSPVPFHFNQSSRSFHFNENNFVPSCSNQIKWTADSGKSSSAISLVPYDNQSEVYAHSSERFSAQSPKPFVERVYLNKRDLTASPMPYRVPERNHSAEINPDRNPVPALGKWVMPSTCDSTVSLASFNDVNRRDCTAVINSNADLVPCYDSELGKWVYCSLSKLTFNQRSSGTAKDGRVFMGANCSTEKYVSANCNYSYERAGAKVSHHNQSLEFGDPVVGDGKVSIHSGLEPIFGTQGNRIDYPVKCIPTARSELLSVGPEMNPGCPYPPKMSQPCQYSPMNQENFAREQNFPLKSEKMAPSNQLYGRFCTGDSDHFDKFEPQLRHQTIPDQIDRRLNIKECGSFQRYETLCKNESDVMSRSAHAPSYSRQMKGEIYIQESNALPHPLPSYSSEHLQQIPMTADLLQRVNNTANHVSLLTCLVNQAPPLQQTSSYIYHQNLIYLNNNKPQASNLQMNSNSKNNIKSLHISSPYAPSELENHSAISPSFHSFSNYSNSPSKNSNYAVSSTGNSVMIEPPRSSVALNNYVDLSDEESLYESCVGDISENNPGSVPPKSLPIATAMSGNLCYRHYCHPDVDPSHVKFCKNQGQVQANLSRINTYSTSTPDSSLSSEVASSNGNPQEEESCGFFRESDHRFSKDFNEGMVGYLEKANQQSFSPHNRNHEQTFFNPECNKHIGRVQKVTDQKTVGYQEHRDEQISRHQKLAQYHECTDKQISQHQQIAHGQTIGVQEHLWEPVEYQGNPKELGNKYERPVDKQASRFPEYPNDTSDQYQECVGEQRIGPVDYCVGQIAKYKEYVNEQVSRNQGYSEDQRPSKNQVCHDERPSKNQGYSDHQAVKCEEYSDKKTIKHQEHLNEQAHRNYKLSDEQARCRKQIFEQHKRLSEYTNKQLFKNGRQDSVVEQTLKNQEYSDEQVQRHEEYSDRRTIRHQKHMDEQAHRSHEPSNVQARCEEQIGEQIIRQPKYSHEQLHRRQKDIDQQRFGVKGHFNNLIVGDNEHCNEQILKNDEPSNKQIAKDNEHFNKRFTNHDQHLDEQIVKNDKQISKDGKNCAKQVVGDDRHSTKKIARDDKHLKNESVKHDEHFKEQIADDRKGIVKDYKRCKEYNARDDKYSNKQITKHDQHSNKQNAGDGNHSSKQITKHDQHSNKRSAGDGSHFSKQITKHDQHSNKQSAGDGNHSSKQITKHGQHSNKQSAGDGNHSSKQITKHDPHLNKQSAEDGNHSNKQIAKHDKHYNKHVLRDDENINKQNVRNLKVFEEQVVINMEHFEKHIAMDEQNCVQQSGTDQKLCVEEKKRPRKCASKQRNKRAASSLKNSDLQVSEQELSGDKQAQRHSGEEIGQNSKPSYDQAFKSQEKTDEQVGNSERVMKESDEWPKYIDRRIDKPEEHDMQIDGVQKNFNSRTNENLPNIDDQIFKRPEPIHNLNQDAKTANKFDALSSESGHGSDSLDWRSRSQSWYSFGSEEDLSRSKDQHGTSRRGMSKRSRRGSGINYGQRSNSSSRIRSLSADGSARFRNSSSANSDRAEIFNCYPFSRIKMDNFELFYNQKQENRRTDMIHLNNKGLGTMFDFLKEKLSK